MTDRAPAPNLKASQQSVRLKKLFGWARIAILWERLWRQLWPCLAVVITFVSISLYGVLPLFPFWLHVLVLAGFGFLFAHRCYLLFKLSYAVNESDIRNRIETESGVKHRPLTTLIDAPVMAENTVAQNAAADYLWLAHQKRAREQIGKFKVGMPKPGLAALDLIGARFAILLFALIAVVSANGHMLERLTEALFPRYNIENMADIDFDIWITPPTYTGLAPLFLEKSDDKKRTGPLFVPVGSTVLAQISGMDVEPRLHIGARMLSVGRVGISDESHDFRLEDTIVGTDQGAQHITLTIEGDRVGQWPVNVLLDGPPEIEFSEPPKRSRRASLQLKFEAKDDFSVKEIWAEISLPNSKQSDADKKRIRFDLTGPHIGQPLVSGQGIRNYSAHRWAGLAVRMQLFAKDSAGQKAESKPLEMVLPARTFNHPVARALVEIRKNLNQPDFDTIEQSIETLYGLLQRPSHFFDNTIVFLSLSVARARLDNDPSISSVTSVQDLLWETALRIEDGEFFIAERDLQEIQDRLTKAMQENAPSEELDRLMDELQQVLSKYLTALAERLDRQGLSQMPVEANVRSMDSMDLQNMIDQARDLTKTGAMDAAKQMLSQLNRMLDGLKKGAARARKDPNMERVRKMMDQMRELEKHQQELMDQTFRKSQSQPSSKQNEKSDQQSLELMEREQAELRSELGRLMLQMDEMLGAIPKGLGDADQSMKRAGKALGEGDTRGAVPRQANALEKLRQAMEQASEQIAKRMQGQGIGAGMGPRGQRPGGNRDPFGRHTGSEGYGAFNDQSGIKVPNQREIYRAREIMDELHRRSGDRKLPQPERDYIDRLLRWF